MPGAPRLGPRAERTRAAILTAAEAVFAEKGFAAARLEDVAVQVDIRRASLVYYFRDKRALYEAVLENLLGELLRRYRAVLDAPGGPADKLYGIARVWLAYVRERPALARIVLREAAESSPSVSAAFADRLRPIAEAVAGVLVEGQRRRVFAPGDPMMIVMTIAGATIFHDAFGRVLDPRWPASSNTPVPVETQVEHVLRILHRLVGDRPLRAVPTARKRARRRNP